MDSSVSYFDLSIKTYILWPLTRTAILCSLLPEDLHSELIFDKAVLVIVT